MTTPTTTILLCVGLLGTACTSSNVSSYHVLLDNSASIPAEVNQETRRQILDAVRDWIKTTASPGDNFTLWWFSETGSRPAHRRVLTMPRLGVPAYAARQAFISDAVEMLEGWFDEMPQGVKHTPLLEAIFVIGLTQNEPWSLEIYSDLNQDSPAWNTQRKQFNDEEALLAWMLELCPIVKILPVGISVKTWPGIVATGRDAVKEHLYNRSMFERFLSRWSPLASVEITSL